MQEHTELGDDLGPARIIHVREPAIGLRGVLVIDNAAAGPSVGGLRMAPDVCTGECMRLARAMTFKNAAAGLPHGGGKSVLWGDPHMPREHKERLVRCFAGALRGEEDYVFGPDMGTDEICMAWVRDEIGRAVGLPAELGGIPLDELGATGWGIRHAARAAAEACGLELAGARVVVQGFGAVGMHSARFLAADGAVLVAAADSRGATRNPRGLDVEALVAWKQEGRSLRDFPGGEPLEGDALLEVECEIWIPAARPDVIREDNAARLRTRLVLQGANIPATPGAEAMLAERGIVSVPDFIANAGGVICAAMEYRGMTRGAAFDTIAEKVGENTAEVLRRAKTEGVLPREAAVRLAERRVRAAMGHRRWPLVSSAPGRL